MENLVLGLKISPGWISPGMREVSDLARTSDEGSLVIRSTVLSIFQQPISHSEQMGADGRVCLKIGL